MIQGNFSHSEALISSCADSGLLSDAIHRFQPCAEWLQIDKESSSADTMELDPRASANPPKPTPRGGHAMCLDQTGGMIYMFGGWDGRKSLDGVSAQRLACFCHGSLRQSIWLDADRSRGVSRSCPPSNHGPERSRLPHNVRCPKMITAEDPH